MDDHSLDRVKQVFEQWSLYDLIIHHNYMRHTELVTCLNKFVKQTEIRREVIDLGCGDAWMAKHVFQDMVLESYLGVDLSDTALQEAADFKQHRNSFAQYLWVVAFWLCRGCA